MLKSKYKTLLQLIREAIRQYRAQLIFKNLAKKGRAAAKKKGFTPKDFGGPFEN